ncbi:glycosyltransferase [Pedomonas mirosovicensis]|uniref:glycosyltransferase n=1 Tax=Pedomonas mirosovicensis TaxID=2908641 RepID=UPI0021693C9E|nr:glycosyltransferase [Pedomonas mirosovicensis]MCH8684306.1 glycosyltransferase [Pedomonas mirosovicensis]
MENDAILETTVTEPAPPFESARRRVLLVTGFFPPLAPSASTRAPTLARYWMDRGYDVRVLAAHNPGKPQVLSHSLPDEAVRFVPFPEVKALRDVLAYHLSGRIPSVEGVAGVAAGGGSGSRSEAKSGPRLRGLPFRQLLADLYWDLMFIPDKHLFWVETGTRAGLEWTKGWKPDLIYSSGPPHSGHLIAARLAQSLSAPWVAELRDEWAGNPYGLESWLRSFLEKRLEQRVLGQAQALVALTATTRQTLMNAYGKPTILSMNGYDPADFAGLENVAPLDPARLTIMHAGSIYIGKRDPSSLFAATAKLGDLKDRVSLLFYGEQADSLQALARKYGVEAQVTISPPIPRNQVLELERRTDVLLLCRWDNPADDGIIPGKLFEYIGAERPILAIGSETGEAADIVREGGFGVVSNNPDVLAAQLREWIARKDAQPRLPDVKSPHKQRFTRSGQFELLDQFVSENIL